MRARCPLLSLRVIDWQSECFPGIHVLKCPLQGCPSPDLIDQSKEDLKALSDALGESGPSSASPACHVLYPNLSHHLKLSVFDRNQFLAYRINTEHWAAANIGPGPTTPTNDPHCPKKHVQAAQCFVLLRYVSHKLFHPGAANFTYLSVSDTAVITDMESSVWSFVFLSERACGVQLCSSSPAHSCVFGGFPLTFVPVEKRTCGVQLWGSSPAQQSTRCLRFSCRSWAVLRTSKTTWSTTASRPPSRGSWWPCTPISRPSMTLTPWRQ